MARNRHLNGSDFIYSLANSVTFPAINNTTEEVRVPIGSKISVMVIGVFDEMISHSYRVIVLDLIRWIEVISMNSDAVINLIEQRKNIDGIIKGNLHCWWHRPRFF